MATYVLVHGGAHGGWIAWIDTGHDLMISEPEAVADALLQVAVG